MCIKLLQAHPVVLYKIKKEYINEFNKKLLKNNIYREKIICFLLILVNVFLTYVDIKSFRKFWDVTPAYKHLFFSHILIVIFLSLFFIMFKLINKIKIFNNLKILKLLHISFISIVLIWCVFLSINAQMIHQQISAYIIGAFCLSSCLILYPKESFFIYLLTYVLFVFGLFFIENNLHSLTGHIINSLFIVLLAFITSILNYNSFAKDFINQKIILTKTRELDDSNKLLEETVKKRTDELTKANKKLIEEINMRHTAELEAFKTNLLYEEKTRILDETKKFEKLRTDFFANISHELRTPLNVIYSAEQMLSLILKNENIKDNKIKINNYMKTIRQNCYRLIRLIGNLIDITKIDAGYFHVVLQNNDIIRIIEDITLSVAEYIESKGINLIFDTEIEEKIIACDPDKIERIILNLLSNAVKFTPKDGNIYVNIYERKDKLLISVKDTGNGIDPEMQASIFERFIQADNSVSKNKYGSGIGLSLVKSLVEMHNGKITVSSILKKGTDFTIELPYHVLPIHDTSNINEEYNNDQHIQRINIEFSDIYF